MREMHHRVQNSLQLVTSMLQLPESDDGESAAREQLATARDRVLSVAMLHRRLWRSEDLQHINLESFFSELVEGLSQTWPGDWRSQLNLDVEPVRVPAHEALLIALIVSELMTNAVKHAYGGGPGPLSLTARVVGDDRVAITVRDRGVGMEVESRSESFGSRLVKRLVSNLGGELRIESANPGSSVSVMVRSGAGE